MRPKTLLFWAIVISFLGSSGLPLTNGLGLSPVGAPIGTKEYTPKFDALNVNQQMTLSPMFTPDNALEIHAYWISRANSTLDVQNQYITMFNTSSSTTVEDWKNDPNPVLREIVKAYQRGVSVRVQVNEDGDSDDVTTFLQSVGIPVRWMGSSANNPDNDYLSATHNKMVIIDGKVSLISSINFGENAFTRNREAGMVIQNEAIAAYYTSIFESDWADGEVPPPLGPGEGVDPPYLNDVEVQLSGFDSHTDIPKANFTGTYNVTAFTNPDNANDVIFKYLKSAKKSIYVSMYTISRPDFNKTLIDLKKANPELDIQVLISRRRVGGTENIDTAAAARSLVENLIPVYNSTDTLNFYHNKYWVIDGKHTFVYSGNWSPRSVSPPLESGDNAYSSGEANRDMGLVVADAPDIAQFFIDEVWKKDVAVASAWELPVGISQTSFEHAEVVSGTVTLSAQGSGIEPTFVGYRFGNGDFQEVSSTDGSFSVQFDTTTLPNGITTFEVKAETPLGTFTDSVRINVANYASSENWRVLVTEVLPNPDAVSDAEGEYFEITNGFPFDVLLGGWQAGTDSKLLTFDSSYVIPAYTSILIARNKDGVNTGYGVTADFELSISLTNSKGYVQLIDSEGSVVDAIAWGDAVAPDGSESVDAPGADEAILREPIYRDTNSASDFVIGTPDPKGTVPNQPLLPPGSTASPTTPSETGLEPVSFGLIPLVAALPILVRRRKQ
ncbi:MAG: hypothetical protein D6732_14015 [Methanobacteriota archaeon]|nr:MAG: hypothetical protein D6732_14015 [Euryarchaeota archaeon]